MDKKRGIFLIAFAVLLLFFINYRAINGRVEMLMEENEQGIVGRIVDGDTEIINGNSTRLLGINTPEKGEFYYKEAGAFLANLTLNKTVKLEFGKDKYDKYGRKLAYIILDGKNINIEQVRNGFANLFIYNNDKYTTELKNAWNECIEKGRNLCEMSSEVCSKCIELKELNVKTQTAIFFNNCSQDCNLKNWTIKDEGRKKFVFPNFVLKGNEELRVIVGNKTSQSNALLWKGETYVWTSTGDTLFLRDKEGKLVLWREINR